ncbi:hypothetical protein [Halorussus ruber]|uniref:hypothetical protein n=1 Tax=Halorussus ruber TaxID=1126238 RepID=UPI001092A1C8|nr:hypothetical protein [Halorussus ruber]
MTSTGSRSKYDWAKQLIKNNRYVNGRWQKALLKAVRTLEKAEGAVTSRISLKRVWKYVRVVRTGMSVLSFFGLSPPAPSMATLKDIAEEIAQILSPDTPRKPNATVA